MTSFQWGDGTQWGDGSTWGIGEPIAPEALSATSSAVSSVDLSWTIVGAADAIRVYRARSESASLGDYTLVDEIGAVESYSDTGVTNGREYHYRVTAVNAIGESGASNNDNATTDLPAPSVDGFAVDTRGEITVGIAVTDNNGEGDVTVERDGVGVGTVAPTPTAFDDNDSILDGEQYSYSLVRDTGDATAESAVDTVVSLLPDEDQPILGNGVEDEVAIDRESAVSNNGSVRIQIRESGESTWDGNAAGFGEFIGAFDTLTMEFVGRLDGEQYEVRARTETDHATGSWTTPVSIVTEFPGATGLSVTVYSQTQISLSWTDNADNEAGQRIVRERRVDGTWWPERIVADAGVDAESFADDTVQPGAEFRYRVRPYTAFASADSNLVTAETPASGLAQDRAPAQGWRVEIDADNGTTRTPAIADPQLQPTINGFPRARFNAEPDETWQQKRYDDAPTRLWRDGIAQPLDIVEHRDVSTESTTFEARGGTELDQRVVARSDAIEPVADFVERLIADETPYDAVVDEISNKIRPDVLLQLADSLAELQAASESIPDDIPLTWDGDDLVPLQTAHVGEGEDGTSNTASDPAFSGGEAGAIDGPGSPDVTFSFTLDYVVPDGAAAVRLRGIEGSGSGTPETVNVLVDGEVVAGDVIEVADTLDWGAEIDVPGGLAAGQHTITIEHSNNFDNVAQLFDAIAFVDTRFGYSWDNTVHEDDGHLDGPEPYPDLVRLALSVINTPLAVDQVTLSAATVGGDPLPELALRQDGTGDHVTETGVTETTIAYSSLEATVQGRVGLGRREGLTPRDQTPRLGYEPQRLDSIELRADLDTTPIFIDRTFDKQLVDILQEAMEVYDGAFEFRSGDPPEIHVSRIDGRPVDIDPDLVDVSVDRSTEGARDRAVIYAAAETIKRLPIEDTVGEWTTLPLGDGRVVEGSETVYDAATADEEPLDRGQDYEFREVVIDGPPEIKLLTSVSEPRIDCDFKPRGVFEADDLPPTPKEIVEDAPELNSKQMADLAAYQAVNGAYTDAVIDATVTLPPGEIGFDVIDALNIAGLPGDAPYQVQDIDVDAERIRVRLGAGQTAGEAVQEIRDKTGRVSERV